MECFVIRQIPSLPRFSSLDYEERPMFLFLKEQAHGKLYKLTFIILESRALSAALPAIRSNSGRNWSMASLTICLVKLLTNLQEKHAPVSGLILYLRRHPKFISYNYIPVQLYNRKV